MSPIGDGNIAAPQRVEQRQRVARPCKAPRQPHLAWWLTCWWWWAIFQHFKSTDLLEKWVELSQNNKDTDRVRESHGMPRKFQICKIWVWYGHQLPVRQFTTGSKRFLVPNMGVFVWWWDWRLNKGCWLSYSTQHVVLFFKNLVMFYKGLIFFWSMTTMLLMIMIFIMALWISWSPSAHLSTIHSTTGGRVRVPTLRGD